MDMTQHLLKEYTSKEVCFALFQIHPSKSPRPDGFPPLFYQKYWSTLGKFVSQYVLNVLESKVVSADINATILH